MKKILFLIPTLNGGGAEKVLVNLCNNIDKNKYEVTIMTIFDIGINKQYLNQEIQYKYIFKKFFRGSTHILKLFSPQFLYKIFIKEEYDIMVAFLEGIATRILSGCKDDTKKKIAWLHVELDDKRKFFNMYRGGVKEAKECYKNYNQIIGVSHMAIKSLADAIGMSEKMCVKYNVVEDDLIRSLGNEALNYQEYFEKDKINMITVGRLTEQKGYERLLKICNKLVDIKQNWHLYILGEGHQREKLENYIKHNKLSEYITLLGYKDNPYKYIKQSDIFVCSSYREGFSTAVTEALILEVPIITTLCSGMDELLNNGEYGLIVKNEEQALYEGILEMLTDMNKMKYYKTKAIERGKMFNKKNTMKEIELIL